MIPDITLYNNDLDERCYPVRLLLSLLDLQWTPVAVDVFPGTEHFTPHFIAMNPVGKLPILRDGPLTLWGPEAILAHLARAYDPEGSWLPLNPAKFGSVMQWLFFAAREIEIVRLARRQALFGPSDPLPSDCLKAKRLLEIMEDHMIARTFSGASWFAASTPTIADIALFPAFALSRDIGIDHNEFSALRRWSRRLRGLRGFVAMPGIPDYH